MTCNSLQACALVFPLFARHNVLNLFRLGGWNARDQWNNQLHTFSVTLSTVGIRSVLIVLFALSCKAVLCTGNWKNWKVANVLWCVVVGSIKEEAMRSCMSRKNNRMVRACETKLLNDSLLLPSLLLIDFRFVSFYLCFFSFIAPCFPCVCICACLCLCTCL